MKKNKFCYSVFTVILSLAFVLILPALGEHVIAAEESLILNLKFDGDLSDSSANSHNGECTYGSISYEEGIFGKCAVFDGKSYIVVKDTNALDLKDNFTISLWAYKEDMKDEYVPYVYKEEDEESWASPYKLYNHWKNTPCIYLHDGDADTELDQILLESVEMDIRKWFLLTVTYDGSEVRMYHNDLLVKKLSITGAPAATIGNLYIGFQDGSIFYKGKMDDLRIYNSAITANEVNSLYDAGLASNPKLLKQTDALVAYYQFENDFYDKTEFGNNAEKVTSEGSIKFVDGVNGKGAKFTKGSYLEVEDNDSINFDEGFTMTGWICLSKSDVVMPLIYRSGASTGYSSDEFSYQVLADDQSLEFEFAPFADQHIINDSDCSITNVKNKWYYFAVTYDGEEVRWYKDGKLISKEEVDQSRISHAHDSLMIGSNGEDFFEGVIDELKLYNYPLKADKVKEDYNQKDSISISNDNQKKIKALKVKGTVTIEVSRKYIETEATKNVTSAATYKSSNAKIFKVSKTGKITAVKKGSANLTVTHGGISKTYKVTVK